MPASRSLIALLVGTVAFFALWLFALKGGSSNPASPPHGVGQYQSAINQAHQAVQTSNASNAASGNDGTSASSGNDTTVTSSAASSGGAAASQTTSSAKPKTAASSSKPAAHLTAKVGRHNKASLARLSTVQQALRSHKVVAMLFYNPGSADDVAVMQQLGAISTHHGQVVKLSIPLSEAANFTPVTQQVPVNVSPTLVLIAPNGQAGEIVGFSDQFEIAQRVDDALATK